MESFGTTSACAENTRSVMLSCWNGWNYLRVRGEYHMKTPRLLYRGELPPRARRIRPIDHNRRPHKGTTSACAENTRGEEPWRGDRRNYLRVRGEYPTNLGVESFHLELPPRARRILLRKHPGLPLSGTTSACAENTQWLTLSKTPWRNYLRVRGEYAASSPISR